MVVLAHPPPEPLIRDVGPPKDNIRGNNTLHCLNNLCMVLLVPWIDQWVSSKRPNRTEIYTSGRQMHNGGVLVVSDYIQFAGDTECPKGSYNSCIILSRNECSLAMHTLISPSCII